MVGSFLFSIRMYVSTINSFCITDPKFLMGLFKIDLIDYQMYLVVPSHDEYI